MLKLFSAGLLANLVYVVSGALKQYFIAAQLPVADVGTYGAWLAQASLLLVLVPFPAYLDVLIKGFSAAPEDDSTRHALIAAVVRELRLGLFGATGLLACALLYALMSSQHHPTAVALLLLLVAQYVGTTSDILLRMCRAHRRYVVFVAARNLPSLFLIVVLGLRSPLAIVVVELLTGAALGWFAHRSNALRRGRSAVPYRLSWTVRRERVVLWMARLVQYVNAALLRLVVPFAFGAHETGLFFFASIAQIPSSLFLSVATQLYGHALARIPQHGYREIARIQLWFLVPNLAYLLAVALVVPYWSSLIGALPGLAQYASVGPLVFALVLYSSILSSDCQEFLLRSRGLSQILLQYNACLIVGQIACLAVCIALELSIERTIVLCGLVAGVVLLGFSSYSFYRVLWVGGVNGTQRSELETVAK